MAQMSIYNELCGVIHVHFPIKKGKKFIPLIIEEGKRAHLNFIILTSHTPKKRKEKFSYLFDIEGYYNDMLIIHGEELDERKKNHLIVIGEKKWLEKNIDEIDKKNNLLKLVAHPFGKHFLFLIKKDYKWEKWQNNFDGMEIWSLLFNWVDKTKIYNIPFRYLKFPLNISSPIEKILKKWDLLNCERKVTGFAGLDIHALPFYFKIFDFKKIFRYKNVFKTLRNYIYLKENLTGKFEEDKEKVLRAIKNGNLFFANDFLKIASGFYFGEKDGKYVCGEEGKIGDIILIRNPIKTRTKLIRNGKIILDENIIEKEIKIEEKGNYRVEVYFKEKNWIFSNNIYIRR
ncbi:MAG: hypothetical protein NC926_01255 [Candidatus Omnitrophica bacterium]|nr:hypothetical protein [Candidatus Omnitrophota bacterium]MCM8806576.1 hypothetical protein [Candidatus Omnitrophota bacterium]